MPRVFPIFPDLTVSIYNAKPLVQIRPDLAPCIHLAMIRMGIEWPAKNDMVACPELARESLDFDLMKHTPIRENRPTINGTFLELDLSTTNHANGENIAEDPGKAARSIDEYVWRSERATLMRSFLG